MAGNEFSPEELKILNKNPYTLKATSKRIMFTLEGKKKILALYEEGKAITQILREMGYDPDMSGHHRTKGIIAKLKEQADSKYGLHNGYARRTPKRMTAEQIAELQENPESYVKLITPATKYFQYLLAQRLDCFVIVSRRCYGIAFLLFRAFKPLSGASIWNHLIAGVIKMRSYTCGRKWSF